MGIDFEVRHNIMAIHSIGGFAGIKGGFHQGCKDVYFVRALGAHTNMVKEIQDMDQTLGFQTQNGKGFYRRLSGLPKMVSQEDIAYYSQCFEEWVRGGRQEIKSRIKACEEEGFRRILSQACGSAGKLYQEGRTQISDSMVKNFMIKLLFWFDFLYGSEGFVWKEGMNAKVVAENVTKEQEYLFWYAVTMTGSDVLLLQYREDVATDKLGLSAYFTLGAYGAVVLPSYVSLESKPEVRKPTTAALEGSLPAGGQRGNREKGRSAATQEATEKNIRIVIPRREDREAPQHSQARQVASGHAAQTTVGSTVHIASGSASRREKTYEELAQMASSVVMIALHDEEGKVRGTGSGIMIGRDGYILTNDHVARGGCFYSVKIEDDDNIYHTDEMIKYNSVLDLAILRIQRRLNPLPVYNGQAKLVRGQRVVAIGSPLGLFNSVSDGIISGFRTINSVDMIQFTAPISSGSSGGAVLNMYGEVIGISTSGYDEGQNINLAMGYECITHFIKGFT